MQSRVLRSSAQQRYGWTLTELLVTLTIVAVLAGLGFWGISSALNYGDKIESDVEAAIAKGRSYPIRVPLAVSSDAPMTNPNRPDFVPNQYVFQLKDTVADPQATAKKIADDLNGKIISFRGRKTGAIVNLEAPNITMDDIRKNDAVADVDRNHVYGTSLQTLPTGVRRMYGRKAAAPSGLTLNLPFRLSERASVPAAGYYSSSIPVAVIDTGVDSTHPDLNVVQKLSFISGDTDPEDGHGHGTHVAGIVAGRDNDFGVVGMAPGAPIWNLRVLNDSGSGTTSDIIDALNYVLDNRDKVFICNMSLGGSKNSLLDSTVNNLAKNGVYVVVAAGNSRTNVSNTSPARAVNAITIAALSDSDGKPGKLGAKTSYGADDTFATYSNYGAGVDFICPGTSITATWPGNKYAKLTGTSMAAPHMAGYLSILFDPNTTVTNGTTSEPLPTGPSGLSAYLSKLGTETIRGPDSRNYLLPQAFVKQPSE